VFGEDNVEEEKTGAEPVEQRLFLLNDEQWESFNAFLDRPPQEKPELRELLTRPRVLG